MTTKQIDYCIELAYIEQFLQGKYSDPLACEDRIVMSEKLVAVIDGASAKLRISSVRLLLSFQR